MPAIPNAMYTVFAGRVMNLSPFTMPQVDFGQATQQSVYVGYIFLGLLFFDIIEICWNMRSMEIAALLFLL